MNRLVLAVCLALYALPARAQAQPADVGAFGARGDCVTDDTPAFNAYAAYLRGRTQGYGGYHQFSLGPDRCYMLRGSVNLTALSYLVFDGRGSRLIGMVTGKAVLDAVGSGAVTFKDFTLIADGHPTNGIQVGRPLNPLSGAASVSIQNVVMDGSYSQAGIYNRAAESSSLINVFVSNRAAGPDAYALIMDGNAHWRIASDFAATYNPTAPDVADGLFPYTAMSFNENLVIGGTLISTHGPAVWMSNFRGHSYIDPYVASGPNQPAAVVYFAPGDRPSDLIWKVHAETNGGILPADILFSGTVPDPVLTGLDYSNHIDMTGKSVLALDKGVTSATIHDLHLRVAAFAAGGRTVLDRPDAWTLDGSVFTPGVGEWNASRFTGIANVGGAISFHGVLAPSVALPSTLDVSRITSTGSVVAIGGIQPVNVYPGGRIPAVAIAAPEGGGSQATAVVARVGGMGTPPAAFGGRPVGYAPGDVVYLPGCVSPLGLRVVVTDGVVTGIGGNNQVGDCPAALMLDRSIAVTGGHGTGLVVDGTALVWRILSVAVTGAGSGYGSPPAVTFSTGLFPAATAVGTAALASSLTLGGGGGQIVMNHAGTALGLAGPAGGPIVSMGALVDGSGVRAILTREPYAVPANTSLVRFVQKRPIGAATIMLPAAVDGQPIQFVVYAGGIGALSFVPAVNGWANTAELAAHTGLRVRWDATEAAWQRE
jgi:hypothetical protein